MKKSFLKLGLLTAGLTALAIPTALSITSCSATSKYPNLIVNRQNGYKLVDTNWTQKITKDSGGAFVLDPNLNTDAIEKIRTTFRTKLDKIALQNDFDNILRRFFNAYEFEENVGNNETEAEITKITVKKVFKSYKEVIDSNELQEGLKPTNSDDAKKEYMYALVNVQYKIEIDNEESDDVDTLRERVEYKNVDKLFTIKPSFSTEAQIFSTIRNLYNQMKQPSTNQQDNSGNKVDVEDLFELYFGDKDNDGKFENDDADDQSIFKQFNLKVNDGIGGLIGYSLDITSLKYEKTPTRNTTMKEIYAPSVSIQEILIPQTPIVPAEPTIPNKPNQTVQKLDFSLNLDILAQKKLDQWATDIIFSNGEIDKARTFIDILSNTETKDWLADKIQSIHVENININGGGSGSTLGSKDNLLSEKAIEVIVQLNDKGNIQGTDVEPNMPKIISIVIQDSWCAQPNTGN